MKITDGKTESKLPLLIITDDKIDGKFQLTPERLVELLEHAYELGFNAGKGSNSISINPYPLQSIPCNDKKQPNINDPFWYERQTAPWWGEVTCETAPEANYVPGITATGTHGSDFNSGGFKGTVKTTLLNKCCDAEAVNCLHKTELFNSDSCEGCNACDNT